MASLQLVHTAPLPASSSKGLPEHIDVAEEAGKRTASFVAILDEQMQEQLDADLEPIETGDAHAEPAELLAEADEKSAVDPASLGLAPFPSTPRSVARTEFATADQSIDADSDTPGAKPERRTASSAVMRDAEPMMSIAKSMSDIAQDNQDQSRFSLSAVTASAESARTEPNATNMGTVAPTESRPAAPATMLLQQPVGSTRWNTELGQTVQLLLRSEQNSATLHVTPPDLGPVDIKIDLAGEQATLHFTVQHADTRSALENALPRLREMLEESGISLGQAQVSEQSAEERDRQSQNSVANNQGTGDSTDQTGTAAAAPQIVQAPIGLVDTYA